MNISRRNFLEALGLTGAAVALPGCSTCPICGWFGKSGKIGLQLYSIRSYIQKLPGGLEKALEDVAEIGYTGVEFAGYYGKSPKELKAMLDANGLVACGTHVGNDTFGFNTAKWTYDADTLKKTCDFNLGYGNDYICCPGGGNMPKHVSWNTGKDGSITTMNEEQEEYVKRLCDLYNKAAVDATKFGCKIGLHNHVWEFTLAFRDGTTYWDYFFSHTDPAVCMEQDIGWTTCAGKDPAEQWAKYPHRSPTLHAKENGMGKGVTEFDAILGQPGKPGATPVDWDKAIDAAEADGVKWWVVECERHDNDLTAVTPSYAFLKAKGLN